MATNPKSTERGQGMNHGIADAASLVRKLKSALMDHSSVKEAIREYSAEMIERAGDEVATSKENTEMLHDWSRMMNSPIMQRGGHARSDA
jgi:2-polyprenyl-6-methoxyphenol hydroxylase-like FAD-dependent oxidoreductase